MTDSPSLLLQRAAELVEQRADDATEGPWSANGYTVYSSATDESVVDVGFDEGGFLKEEDAAWAAMANPLLAQPLANILRDAAFTLDAHPEYRTHYLSYIALAEAVLGAEKEKLA